MSSSQFQFSFRRSLWLSLGLVAALIVVPRSQASIYNGSSGNLNASVQFTAIGNTLTVVLTNTSAFDVMQPSEVLTAVFFDIVGYPPATLTPISALLTSGSVVVYGPTNGGNVGGEYGYESAIVGAPASAVLGVSSSGFGLFGQPNFNGPNLQGPTGLDGLQYGITSAGDNTATGNAPVTGGNALIKNSVTFTLTSSTLIADADISNVTFQYGTALAEPHVTGVLVVPPPGGGNVPEAASLVVWSLLLVSVAVAGKRRRSA